MGLTGGLLAMTCVALLGQGACGDAGSDADSSSDSTSTSDSTSEDTIEPETVLEPDTALDLAPETETDLAPESESETESETESESETETETETETESESETETESESETETETETETESETETETATDTPESTRDCSDLPTASTADQIAIVRADPTGCAPVLVAALEADPSPHLDAFFALVADPTTTDALFGALYDEIRFQRFRFERPAVDVLWTGLPSAVAQCSGSFRCPGDWTTFVLGPLARGEMFACPSLDSATLDTLLATLPYGDYACTELLAAALVPIASDAALDQILATIATHPWDWSRRNALRVVGRFTEASPESPAHPLVMTLRSGDVQAAVHDRVAHDLAEDVLQDAIWILDARYYPYPAMVSDLARIAADPQFSSSLRFRAMTAYARLLYLGATLLSAAERDFLLASLASDDPWVRAEAAYIVMSLHDSQLDDALRATLVAALETAYDVETDLAPRLYLAKALDHFHGDTALADAIQADFEAMHLPHTGTSGAFVVRSGLTLPEIDAILALLLAEADAFADLMGPPFATPVPGDTNDGMTLVLFATRAEYIDYMGSFVGYGAAAGGLYLEGDGILYTYQRTAAESVFTVEQLIQHEFGHYLQGRFVYPGLWQEAATQIQPRAWADEGFAELLGGLAFHAPDAGGKAYTIALRPEHLATLCPVTPYRELGALISQRVGYTESGVFDYPNGWALSHYLFTTRRADALRLYLALRDATYTTDTFAAILGDASLDGTQRAWHASLASWCAPAPFAAPSLMPLPRGSVCETVARLRDVAVAPPAGPIPPTR